MGLPIIHLDSAGSGGSGVDEFVSVSAVDTTPNFLSTKLIAGVDISYAKTGAGNETMSPVLSDTGVVAGSYTSVDVTVDARGRITAISNGGASGVDKIACCVFGAKSDGLGKFLIANGKSSDGDDDSKPKTRQPIGLNGTLTKLVYKTKEATSSTQMKIHVNGTVEATVLLSSINANFGGVETISISVVSGDYVEIEYDSSDKPGECTMYFIQELT